MIHQRLQSFLQKRHCTLLGVGPMSVNCVDATIELANEHEVPILMIASRRQIDSEEFGGGYVNNWTTQEFAQYVIDKDKKGKILLARDHGGPWQSIKEKDAKLGLRRAMDSAKASYRADISAGFQVLHIDPSVDIHGQPDVDEVLDRVFDLYDFCWTQAQQSRQEVIFEVGTEEQSGSTNSQEELDYTLNAIKKFCTQNKIPQPTFVVIQCGTRVMEMRNVGSFDSPVRVANEIPAEIQLPKMIEICNKHNILMKEHNTDYLSDDALQWHPRLGIHAANVAPEFGVAESKALVNILENNNLTSIADRFLNIAYDSKKWDKWMIDNTAATDRDRSLIAGHYVFSTPTRPELIKMSRVIAELDRHTRHVLVHTGQNYDYELNQIFFEDLEIRKPDHFLGAVGENAAQTIAQVILKADEIMAKEEPDALLLYGDTNSCLAVIAAKRRKIPVFHMEAGNRCFDQRVPEELNRKVLDHLSDINLVLTEHGQGPIASGGRRWAWSIGGRGC